MTANQDESQLYQELAEFLASERVDLRISATEAILQVQQNHDEMEKLVHHGLVKPLAKNFSHSNAKVGINALRSLVILTSQGTPACSHLCLEELMAVGGINRVTEVILSTPPPTTTANSAREDKDDSPVTLWKKRVNFAMALLANLTRAEVGAVELVGKTLPENAVAPQQLTEEEKEKLPSKPLLELMLSRFFRDDFCSNNSSVSISDNNRESHQSDTKDDDGATAVLPDDTDVQQDSNHNDPYQHFAAVLMNCAQTEAARKFMLKIRRKHDKDDNPTSVFQALLSQLRSPNPIRRRGIAGMIRNCCLEVDSAWWFLNQVKLAKHLMYPLAGPEELDLDEKKGLEPDLWLEGPDKVREPDATTRLYLVEALLVLCASGRRSRETLRLARIYVVLKWADMVEENEQVSERIEECVQFLRRDEEGTPEGSSDMMVEESLKRPKTSGQITMLNDEDYNAVD
jgi:Domain of unknown function (DUF383)/Domain of unknown function (DUF384)